MELENFDSEILTHGSEEGEIYEQRPLVSKLSSRVSHSVIWMAKNYVLPNLSLLSENMETKVKDVFMALASNFVELNYLSSLERRQFKLEFHEGINKKIIGVHLDHPLCPRDSDTILLYLHGGGFIAGSVSSHASILKRLMLKTHLPIFFLEYSLSPAAKYPTQLNECIEVYEKLIQKYKKVILVGDSAGANLATATTMKIIERKLRLPTAVVMMSPWLDLSFSGASSESRCDHDVLIDKVNGIMYAEKYTEKENFRNPYVSPVFGTSDMFMDFPPTLIHVGDHEVLLDDSIRFAKLLPKKRARVVVWDNMLHVFQGMAITESELSFQEIAEFICAQAGNRISSNH